MASVLHTFNRLISKIRYKMDDYNKILTEINTAYEGTIFKEITSLERTMGLEWIITQKRLRRTNQNRAQMLVKLLLITYQLNILIAANAPKKAMNWKRTWKYIRKQSILTKKNSDILKPYWLKNRYGKIRSNREYLPRLMDTKEQVVYYFANIWTKHAYVGETNNSKGWQYRIQQEIRTAKGIFYDRHKQLKTTTRYADRIMGYVGFFTWCVMPIYTR